MGTVTPVRDLLHHLGIDKNLRLENGRLAVPNLPSICLGAVDLTLMEMTGAYSAFGNSGTYVQPVFVSRIEDKNGKVIYQDIPKRKSAINPLYNAVMVEMLKNNVGGRFSLSIKSKIGGKTGTTNDYADGWFMGVTPTLITGTWTGGNDEWIRFLTLDEGQGYVMARPISELFLKKLEKMPKVDMTGKLISHRHRQDWKSLSIVLNIKPSDQRQNDIYCKNKNSKMKFLMMNFEIIIPGS